jgi:DNA-directed RNA polymerase subunit F
VDFGKSFAELGDNLKKWQGKILDLAPDDKKEGIKKIFAEGNKAIENFDKVNPTELQDKLMQEAMNLVKQH